MIATLIAAAAVAAAPPAKPVWATPTGGVSSTPPETQKPFGACGGGPVGICKTDGGRLFLQLDVPPCNTKEAESAAQCLEWVVRRDTRYLVVPPKQPATK